jgi:hypothetical protein
VENEDEEDLQDTFINESEDFLGDEGDEGDIDEANQLSLDID